MQFQALDINQIQQRTCLHDLNLQPWAVEQAEGDEHEEGPP